MAPLEVSVLVIFVVDVEEHMKADQRVSLLAKNVCIQCGCLSCNVQSLIQKHQLVILSPIGDIHI